MAQYLPIVVMLVLGVFAGVSLVMSTPGQPEAATRPPSRRPTSAASSPGRTRPSASRCAYLVAMIFIVVDIEIIFLYPYVIIHDELGFFGLLEMLVFAVAVFASFVYLIANGALDWGPVQRLRRIDPAVSAERTTTSTVRRVGQEGRPPATEAA
ncbi:MAG: NADH-quinone oxidoreductase subunit A [Acidimicrobiales bacterium]